MPNLHYLRCRICHETLQDHTQAYCQPCNLYLMYRAMPILLGMLMTGVIKLDSRLMEAHVPLYDADLCGYECADAICWE